MSITAPIFWSSEFIPAEFVAIVALLLPKMERFLILRQPSS